MEHTLIEGPLGFSSLRINPANGNLIPNAVLMEGISDENAKHQ